MTRKNRSSVVRKAVSKFKGQGGVIVPGGGGGVFRPYSPNQTEMGVRGWNNGYGLKGGAQPDFEGRVAMARGTIPVVGAALGAIQIGKLANGVKNYFRELGSETDSYTKAGEAADRVRLMAIARRKKK